MQPLLSQRDGEAIEWRISCSRMDEQIYLLAVRFKSLARNGDEHFVIVGMTLVKCSSYTGSITTTLTATERFTVKAGDVLGFYFPQQNPLPYDEAACFSQEDQLRYLYDPMDVTLGKAYQFKVAPLAWNPCREYSLQLIIGKQTHDSA